MKQNFIKTTDSSTAAALQKIGFQKVDEQNGVYTFINDQTLKFDDNIDMNKINFSNMLYI